MNVIRVSNSAFRTNSSILCTHAKTFQSMFFSSSQNDGNDNKKDDENSEGSGNEKNDKLGDMKKRSKFIKLQKSRKEQGYKAFYDLLNSSEIDSQQKYLNANGQKMKNDPAPFSESPGDFKKLNRLLESSPIESHDKKTVLPSEKVIKPRISEGLLQKVRAAAVELGGDVEVTQKELLAAYRSVQDPPHKNFQKPRDKSSLMSETYSGKDGFKQRSNAFAVKRITGDKKLGIFTEMVEDQEDPTLKLWHQLNARSLIDSSMQAPKNYFEQLILWTHQGKLWQFPIDNEQGMDQEKQVDFSEHVFLDKHLEPWCPKTGPLRHFMELVTVGLSKNPYLSVQQKKDHIMWYRDYFEKKRKLLNELGVLDNVETADI